MGPAAEPLSGEAEEDDDGDGESGGGAATEALAGRRQPGRVAGTVDQFDAEPCFQRLDAAAEGRLR